MHFEGQFVGEKKASEYEASVSLKFKRQAEHLELPSEVAHQPDFTEVLSDGRVTHVVTKVTTGANVVFKFSKRTRSLSEAKQISGNLKIDLQLLIGM